MVSLAAFQHSLFFCHNLRHSSFLIILDIFSFLSCCVRLVSRRGPLCLWQHREEAACRGGGQAGELRLQFDVDLYRAVYKFISTSVASAIIAQKP